MRIRVGVSADQEEFASRLDSSRNFATSIREEEEGKMERKEVSRLRRFAPIAQDCA